ncbi:exodeoxyribonuclease V subunit alpha [Nocardioides massiliensis]|uniref:RecBCD enzyme subunit RecD n=1 Tax=Nocardioides massiliensis TaxID=1325935 RepID=A0ABT9NSH9_9ACTN|nr:exodeoxyribonuclease V subunit alpha [Nocardioides massiliensis]MDP9823374.1 exodeoxyribonuclease V alpha subunit [Nocardioides massiliensis]
MSELFEPLDGYDRRLLGVPDGTPDELVAFNVAGVLTAADIHVATTVGRLGGESSPEVLLAVALTVRAVRFGSVGLDLATVADSLEGALSVDQRGTLPWPDPDRWRSVVAASPLLRAGVVHLDTELLHLDRYHALEVQVCDDLLVRLDAEVPAPDETLLQAGAHRVFPGEGYAEQRAAAAAAVRQPTTVLTGGPGTGKTTTVAGLLVLLREQAERRGEELRVGLAAPTAKAAARLREAIEEAADQLPVADRDRVRGLEATTLHRLLGFRPDNATRFRHHRGNRLPHDVVLVDETSMMSLTMTARLLEAVRPDARLILVGDPDQLASVEAGVVLGDLVAGLAEHPHTPVVGLRTVHRYGEGIGALARALRAGDADEVLGVLRAGAPGVTFAETDDPVPALREACTSAALRMHAAAEAGDAPGALAVLEQHRLLCAHRDGPAGVRHWNALVEQWLAEATGHHGRSGIGRPLLVTANDYALGVLNGDAGVVVATPDGPRAFFTGGDAFAPARLGDVDTMYAMTIHKAQGSQAAEVSVLLPPEDSLLLTRELFYTAVTRAREHVRVVGTEAAVRAAVERRVQRASGLRRRLQVS